MNEEWGARTVSLAGPFTNTIFVIGPVAWRQHKS